MDSPVESLQLSAPCQLRARVSPDLISHTRHNEETERAGFQHVKIRTASIWAACQWHSGAQYLSNFNWDIGGISLGSWSGPFWCGLRVCSIPVCALDSSLSLPGSGTHRPLLLLRHRLFGDADSRGQQLCQGLPMADIQLCYCNWKNPYLFYWCYNIAYKGFNNNEICQLSSSLID